MAEYQGGSPRTILIKLKIKRGTFNMPDRMAAWLSLSLCAAGLVTAIAIAAPAERLIFLSTQLRPIEEAQKMRNLILKSFPRAVDYITEQPQQFPVRIEAEEEGGAHTIDVVGAL